ncbi:hypothetical protein HMI54_002165 [Coelomomyces lativittatus]|nr:hypothetical protein HMI54_002165 [Coelomomyces lativittatus]
MIDFGFPQITDAETLKAFMTSESVKSESSTFETLAHQASKLTLQATSTASWRRSDIKYRKNEVFVDVIEKVNFLVSNKGTLLKSSVDGSIRVKAFLSGQPECHVGLNEKISILKPAGGGTAAENSSSSRPNFQLDDFQCHPCVNLKVEQDTNVLSFVPPDGEFELLNYRSMSPFQLPIMVYPNVNVLSDTRLEFRIQMKSMFVRKFTATEVVIRIPVPLNTAQVNGLGSFSQGAGKAKYVASENAIVWRIPRISGNGELELTAEAELTSTMEKKPWIRPPISVEFNISMYIVSGLKVRFLKVIERTNYSTIKWVRYNSKSGDCQFRF